MATKKISEAVQRNIEATCLAMECTMALLETEREGCEEPADAGLEALLHALESAAFSIDETLVCMRRLLRPFK